MSEKQRERERQQKREREGGEILYSSVNWSQLSVSHNRPYRTVSCAASAYFLYAPHDSITILLYNLKTKRRTNFC